MTVDLDQVPTLESGEATVVSQDTKYKQTR